MKNLLLSLSMLIGLVLPVSAQTDYIIGPQDVVAVTVFGEPELSGKYTVEQDGTFTFPQLGRITAGGTTPLVEIPTPSQGFGHSLGLRHHHDPFHFTMRFCCHCFDRCWK